MDKLFKVLDCEDAETEFEQTGNPSALVLAAQQLAQATQRDPWTRYEGRVEGRVEGLVEGLLQALHARFGTVPEAVRQRVQGVREESRLCKGMRLVITEPTLEQFLAKS